MQRGLGHGAGCLALYRLKIGNNQHGISFHVFSDQVCAQNFMSHWLPLEPFAVPQPLVRELGCLGLSNKYLQLLVCKLLLVGVEGCERG